MTSTKTKPNSVEIATGTITLSDEEWRNYQALPEDDQESYRLWSPVWEILGDVAYSMYVRARHMKGTKGVTPLHEGPAPVSMAEDAAMEVFSWPCQHVHQPYGLPEEQCPGRFSLRLSAFYGDETQESLAEMFSIESRGHFQKKRDASGAIVGHGCELARPTLNKDGLDAYGQKPVTERILAALLAAVDDSRAEWLMVKLKRAVAGGEVQWLIPGVLECGKLMALFGPPKTGKSLWMQEQVFKLVKDGQTVVYFDEENDPLDVYERALDMGYDMTEMSSLKYHCFKGLNVDVEEDAEKILELCDGADLVVFDSFARVVSRGSQSDDAAISRAYKLTFSPLKKKGASVVRLDHTGHGEANRPSGSVQKLADVDHNWLIKAESASAREERKVTLIHTENRTGRGEDLIVMDRRMNPLRHVVRGQESTVEDLEAATVEDARVQAVVDALDELGVPLTHSVSQCEAILKAASKGARKTTVATAQRIRKSTPA